MQNLLDLPAPACLPVPACRPACRWLRARCHAAMQQAVAGGWWLVAGGLRARCSDRGGRAGLDLGVSVTAPSTNNFFIF